LSFATKTILQGWKEIAEWLGRDVRTVKRWEKQRQLPVRRMPGEGRSNVYIRVAELEEWLDCGGLPNPAAESPALAPVAPLPPLPAQTSWRTWRMSMGLTGLIFCTTAALFAVHAHRIRPVAAALATRYVSPVAGVDDLYLRGVYFYELHTPSSLTQARTFLQQAVALDPADAPAWSALASTTLMLEQFEGLPPRQAFDEAGTAASHALALDPSLADAHASLAFVDFLWSHDPASAEREFRTALALNPNSSIAHHRYGLMLLQQRRFPEALAEFDVALRLQPGSTSVLAGRALALGFNGHRDDAVQVLQSMAAQQPQNPIIFHNLALLAQMQPHNVPLYLDSLRHLQQIEHKTTPWTDFAARAYRNGGEPAIWQAIVASETNSKVESFAKAAALAQLGQSSAALDILERETQHPGDGMEGLAIDPAFDSLHHDPRFQYLLARIGLPPVQ
jgi:Tfp pilus assembly protein PilF